MPYLLPLSTNYRSHPKIVDWCDNYIQSFDVMTQSGARVSGKPNLSPDPQWVDRQTERGCSIGDYPAVSYLPGQNYEDVAVNFAETVRGLWDNGIVSDPSSMRASVEEHTTFASISRAVSKSIAGPRIRGL